MEYVCHDLTTEGKCSTTSKLFLLQDWLLPPHGISLLSFIGLCFFYNRYCPWFESNIKPLQKLKQNYHRNVIPLIGWTPALITRFCDCKTHLVAPPPLSIVHDPPSLKQIFPPEEWTTFSCSLMTHQSL